LNKTNAVKFNKACSDSVMEGMEDIEAMKVSSCTQRSFVDGSRPDVSNNTLLANDAYERKELGAWMLPSIMINKRLPYKGSLKGANVFEAICAGFLKKPQICYDESDFRKPPNENTQSMSWTTIFFIIIIVLIINLLIYLLCRRYISKKIMERLETTDINHRINTVVTSYLALKESK